LATDASVPLTNVTEIEIEDCSSLWLPVEKWKGRELKSSQQTTSSVRQRNRVAAAAAATCNIHSPEAVQVCAKEFLAAEIIKHECSHFKFVE